ncbi:MAG: hypothetical protein M1831_001872 [Alyxoria varia]|nr:MAG: hypothetical protein M1831_001872 [Alyxoria varia]
MAEHAASFEAISTGSIKRSSRPLTRSPSRTGLVTSPGTGLPCAWRLLPPRVLCRWKRPSQISVDRPVAGNSLFRRISYPNGSKNGPGDYQGEQAAQAAAPFPRGPSNKRAPVPFEERERRRREHLCAICASVDHDTRGCPSYIANRAKPHKTRSNWRDADGYSHSGELDRPVPREFNESWTEVCQPRLESRNRPREQADADDGWGGEARHDDGDDGEDGGGDANGWGDRADTNGWVDQGHSNGWGEQEEVNGWDAQDQTRHDKQQPWEEIGRTEPEDVRW